MKKKTKEFLAELGRDLAARRWDKATAHLAGWLPEKERARFQSELLAKEREVRAEFSDQEIGEPDGLLTGDNPCSWQDLLEDGVALPPEITESNFVGWCCLTLTADEEEWSLFDLWCAVVEEDGAYKLGYFEVHDPD